MNKSWLEAYQLYDWTVNLSNYEHSNKFINYFNDVVTPKNTTNFEDKFRIVVNRGVVRESAGEVCYWKNYGSFQNRNRLTDKILEYLEKPSAQQKFACSVKAIEANPSFSNFKNLQYSCGQKNGFATPITFLAFFNPQIYPMVDKHIAYWWNANKSKYGFECEASFSQRNDGWIQTTITSQTKQNWHAYLAWTAFCNAYSEKLSVTYNQSWRARDVEIAVWEAKKKGIELFCE